jgi:putative hydrolases of HD superfamily
VDTPANEPTERLTALAERVDAGLADRLRFVVELDRLKSVLRRTRIGDGSRLENSAEHSWHVAAMALVLAEHAAEPVDSERVALLLLVHDVVEIDAGDTFVYDTDAQATKDERERRAADRLFGALPKAQHDVLRGAWEEYETGDSAEARFARALDRLQPMLLNYLTEGAAWRAHGITAGRVLEVNAPIAEGAPDLWALARGLVEDAVARGWLPEGEPTSGS